MVRVCVVCGVCAGLQGGGGIEGVCEKLRERLMYGVGVMFLVVKMHKVRADSSFLVADGVLAARPIVSRKEDYSTIVAKMALDGLAMHRVAYDECLEEEKPEGCVRGNFVVSSTEEACAKLGREFGAGEDCEGAGLYSSDIENYFSRVPLEYVREGVMELVRGGTWHLLKEENYLGLVREQVCAGCVFVVGAVGVAMLCVSV